MKRQRPKRTGSLVVNCTRWSAGRFIGQAMLTATRKYSRIEGDIVNFTVHNRSGSKALNVDIKMYELKKIMRLLPGKPEHSAKAIENER